MKPYHLYLEIVLMLILINFGIWILWVGIKGIWVRRPVYIVDRDASVLYSIFFFLFWTVIIASSGLKILAINDNGTSLGAILAVILVSILFAFVVGVLPQMSRAKSSSMAGVMILGINIKVLELLRRALLREGIAFREANEDFELYELRSQIYTSIWKGIGYAALKIDPKEKLPVL